MNKLEPIRPSGSLLMFVIVSNAYTVANCIRILHILLKLISHELRASQQFWN